METRTQIELISQIANRAMALFEKHGISEDKLSVMMDIEYVNEVNPLRLNELLLAPEGDFSHDMFGIREHFDRQNKRLLNCFAPRYSLGDLADADLFECEACHKVFDNDDSIRTDIGLVCVYCTE